MRVASAPPGTDDGAPPRRRPASGSLAARAAVGVAGLAVLAGGLLAAGMWPDGPPVQPRVVEEVPVTAMDQGLGVAHNTPVVRVDPTEPRFVVIGNRLDAPRFDCALQVSGDGGRSFVSVEPVPELPEGAETCYGPEVAFDADGRLYYLFVGLAGAGNRPVGVYLTTSEDRGQTFSAPRQVLGPLRFGVRMGLDPTVGRAGRLHLVWIEAGAEPSLGGFAAAANPVMAAYSDDGGASFSEPVQVSDPDRRRVVAPALALGPDQAVHVAYYDLQDDAVDYQGLEGPVWPGAWSLVVASSGDGGHSFGSGVVVDDGVVPHQRVMLVFTMAPPALAVGADGAPCVAWTDARHGDADVLAACAAGRGQGWGQARRVNDDPAGNGRWQYLPQLGVAPDGRLDVVFFDRREDPGNVLTHLGYAYSTDGGDSFAPTLRVSAEASDSRIGQEYVHAAAQGLYEHGSRLGLVSRRGEVVAVWPDTRNSLAATTGQDLWVATVAVPAGGPGWARPAGAVLLVVGLVGLVVAVGGLRRGRATAGDQAATAATATGGHP